MRTLDTRKNTKVENSMWKIDQIDQIDQIDIKLLALSRYVYAVLTLDGTLKLRILWENEKICLTKRIKRGTSLNVE